MPRASAKRDDGRFVAKYGGKYFYGRTQSEARAKRDEYKRQTLDFQGFFLFPLFRKMP